jgi:hypothetical protein
MAAANFCKFAIRGTINVDHAGDRQKVALSLPYVAADLRHLKPKHLILPRSIWKHRAVQELLAKAAPQATVVPLPQFNAQVVNVHLAKHAAKGRRLERAMRTSIVSKWIGRLKGYAPRSPWRYLVEIDEVLGC